MPARISMSIQNPNIERMRINEYLTRQMASANTPASRTVTAPPKPTALNTSMIRRIHNVQPGCGSCGRH
jgi:hypothetical protein